MEKYLDRCLSSVTSISNLDQVEVLVVNDGSTDNSLEIAKSYEQRFPSSVHVIDKPNGGWGSGINRSIKEATGKYYKSLDSDDWFDSVNLECYVNELNTIDCDLILTPFLEVDEFNNILAEHTYNASLAEKTMTLEEYMIINGGFSKTIHAVTYRTNFLRDNDIIIWEKFYGDIDYINSPLPLVKTIYQSNNNVYRYFVGREGQSISIEGYRKHIDDYINVCKKLILINASLDSSVPFQIKQYLDQDTLSMVCFAFKLMLEPKMCGNETGSLSKLKDFDRFISTNHAVLSKRLNKYKTRAALSPINIWRATGINLYKIFGR